MNDETEAPFALWQGFRHSWTYNHRLNRIGDWMDITARDGDRLELETGHSGASGSGRDKASYRSFRTATRAHGVHFAEARRSVSILSKEQDTQVFAEEFRISGVPEDHDRFEAVLAGFDLCSEKDADKLISFHLAASTPERDPDTGDVVFAVIGALNVDCDSPECDNWGSTGAMIAAIALGAVTGIGLVGTVGAAVLGGLTGGLLAKLRVSTDYTLEIRAALISGRADSLAITREDREHDLEWDKETAITRKTEGTVPFTLTGNDDPAWTVCVPAINRIALEVTRERGFLKPDTAMHLLEWDMAVLPDQADGVTCSGTLELFFRNWRNRESRFLDEHVESPVFDELIEDIVSHRDAGTADIEMGLSLLQFAHAAPGETTFWESSHIWEGKGASAKSEAAVRRGTHTHAIAAPPLPEPEPVPVADNAALRIAIEQLL